MKIERVGVRNLKLPSYARREDLPKIFTQINKPATRLDGVRALSRVYEEEPIEIWTPKGFKGVAGYAGGSYLGATLDGRLYLESRRSRACAEVADYSGEAWSAWWAFEGVDEDCATARKIWDGYRGHDALLDGDGQPLPPTTLFRRLHEEVESSGDENLGALLVQIEMEYAQREEHDGRWPADYQTVDALRAFTQRGRGGETYWASDYWDNSASNLAGELKAIGLGGMYVDQVDPQKVSEAYRRIAEGSTP